MSSDLRGATFNCPQRVEIVESKWGVERERQASNRRPACSRPLNIILPLQRGALKRQNPPVKHWQTTLGILTALFASIALGDDFKTINGKEYKNVTVSRVEPDGIVLRTKSGISKVYFLELPKEVRDRFHYNSAQAAGYSAQVALQALQTRYQWLHQQEQVILQQLDSTRSGTARKALHRELNDVRRDKNQIETEIEEAQRQPQRQQEESQRKVAEQQQVQSNETSTVNEPKESQTEGAQASPGEKELKVKVEQVLPDGILADGSVAKWQAFTGGGTSGEGVGGSYGTVYGNGKAIFLQGFHDGVAEGEVFQVQAYPDGTYTYRDASSTSRTLEKWVFIKVIKRLE